VSTALGGVAVVTGSSGGIGRAVAVALAAHGMSVCVTGRDTERLGCAAREVGAHGAVLALEADLGCEDGVRGLAERITSELGRLDVLVHAAGTATLGRVDAAAAGDLDEQYRVNLRAPLLLTRALLDLVKDSCGQVVFVNSSAGLAPGSGNGVYAATKHALRSLASSLRDELNPHGVRVLSVYPGRTATPMQERVHEAEGRAYEAASLLQPRDVADMIVAALALPRTAEVTDIMLRPMKKAPLGRSFQ
jgi:NADP-dependent 3-hydroxy acid dehydrogenase YdfG